MAVGGADPILDVRGLNCPLPVLKTRKRLAGMPVGARLQVLTTDTLATLDIPAFCAESGHRLVESEPDGAGHRFTIQRS